MPGTRIGPLAHGIAAALVIAVLSACSPSRQPDDVEPTTTPNAAPWSGEFLYRPVDEELCDQVHWSDIGAEFGMTFEGVESDRAGPAWQVRCTVGEIRADYLDDATALSNLVEINVIVFEEPKDAHAAYSASINSETFQSYSASEIDGWWTEGVLRESPGVEHGTILYHVYDENMMVAFVLNWHGMNGPEWVSNVHGVARAVLEEVKVQLPCRSLVHPPVSGCD